MVYTSDCLVKDILSGRFDCRPSQGIKCHYLNLPTWVEQRLQLRYSCALSDEAGLQSCWRAGEMQLFARSYAKCWRSHESASTEKRCLEVILPNHPLEHTRRRLPSSKKVPHLVFGDSKNYWTLLCAGQLPVEIEGVPSDDDDWWCTDETSKDHYNGRLPRFTGLTRNHLSSGCQRNLCWPLCIFAIGLFWTGFLVRVVRSW